MFGIFRSRQYCSYNQKISCHSQECYGMKKIAKVSLSEINVQDDYSPTLIKALKKKQKLQKNNSLRQTTESKKR